MAHVTLRRQTRNFTSKSTPTVTAALATPPATAIEPTVRAPKRLTARLSVVMGAPPALTAELAAASTVAASGASAAITSATSLTP